MHYVCVFTYFELKNTLCKLKIKHIFIATFFVSPQLGGPLFQYFSYHST